MAFAGLRRACLTANFPFVLDHGLEETVSSFRNRLSDGNMAEGLPAFRYQFGDLELQFIRVLGGDEVVSFDFHG